VRGVASIWAILLLWLLTAGRGNGQSNQSLTGEILDTTTGGPIASADVSLVGTGFEAVTDQFGRFALENIPPGEYRIRVVRLGYETIPEQVVVVSEDITTTVRLCLNPQPVALTGQKITAEREQPRVGTLAVLTKEEIRQTPDQTLAGLLQQIDGLFVESGRNPGEDLRVRIRGCDPDQVLILLDGQRLNSVGTGDVSAAVPVEAIERIEVVRGGASARYGSDAMSGVINIITHRSGRASAARAGATFGRGNWDQRFGTVEAETPLPIGGGEIRVIHRGGSTDDDFPFRITVEPEGVEVTGRRINNRNSQTATFIGGRYDLSRRSIWRATLHQYEAEAGLPGRADEQNQWAEREDRRTLFNLEGSSEFGSWSLINRAGYSWQRQLYLDTLSAPLSQYRTRYHCRNVNLMAEGSRTFWRRSRVAIGLERSYDKFQHEDLLRPKRSTGFSYRSTWAAYSQLDFRYDLPRALWLRTVDLNLSLRHDYSRSWPEIETEDTPLAAGRHGVSFEENSPALGMSLTGGEKFAVTLRANAGKSFRLPGLTSLFWFGDVRSSGNPDLRPERSESYDLGAEMAWSISKVMLRFGSTFYRNELTDLVVWVEGSQAVWSPVNLGSALITGHEDFVSLELLHGDLKFRFANTVAHPLNKVEGHNSYDRDLTFTPRFVTTLSAQLDRERYYLRYDVRRVARRYALTGNEKWYDGYTVHDFAAGVNHNLLPHVSGSLNLRIQNLFDEDYVLIANHPMPARQGNIEIKLSYLFGNER